MAGRIFMLTLLGRFCSLLPESRLFKFKAVLYRSVGGLEIDPASRIYSSVRFGTYPISIGARTHIGYGCLFIGAIGCSISIGRDCDIAPEVIFMTGTHELGGQKRRAGKDVAYPIRIGDGTWIGSRAMILPGVEIGPGCIIAAGSVVNKSVPPNTLAAGVPATAKKLLPT